MQGFHTATYFHRMFTISNLSPAELTLNLVIILRKEVHQSIYAPSPTHPLAPGYLAIHLEKHHGKILVIVNFDVPHHKHPGN